MFDNPIKKYEEKATRGLTDEDLKNIAKDIPVEEINLTERKYIQPQNPIPQNPVYYPIQQNPVPYQIPQQNTTPNNPFREPEKKDPFVRKENGNGNNYVLYIIASIIGLLLVIFFAIHTYQDYRYNSLYETKDLSPKVDVQTPVNIQNPINITENPITINNFNNVTLKNEITVYCNQTGNHS